MEFINYTYNTYTRRRDEIGTLFFVRKTCDCLMLMSMKSGEKGKSKVKARNAPSEHIEWPISLYYHLVELPVGFLPARYALSTTKSREKVDTELETERRRSTLWDVEYSSSTHMVCPQVQMAVVINVYSGNRNVTSIKRTIHRTTKKKNIVGSSDRRFYILYRFILFHIVLYLRLFYDIFYVLKLFESRRIIAKVLK